jgi:YD repeat-containing protein
MFDQSDRLTAVELPGVYNPATSQIESPRYVYAYDAEGSQTLLRDPLGRETWFTFDAQNRQVSRTLPLGFGEDGIRGTGDDPVSWRKKGTGPFVY